MAPLRAGENELIYQIRHPYFFYWVSNGWFIDHLIHHVDECCWIKDGWPVSAEGLGGRVPAGEDCSQNWHQYAIEYTFADGTKAYVDSRAASGCREDFVTYLHGSKCAAQFSGSIHAPTVRTYQDQRTENSNVAWRAEMETVNPYHAEWKALLEAIRDNKPHNETQRACNTNYTCLMGRAAVHTGQIVTWDQITASNFMFAPNADSLTADSPAPVRPDAAGHYPVPVPGTWKEM
jgi:predicted dehydrogenase